MSRPTDRPHRRLVIGVSAVVLLLTGACDGGDAPRTDQPPVATGASEDPADANAEEVATGFLEAFGAFDVNQAMTYLGDDAVISSMSADDDARLLMSYLEATGYEQILDPCEGGGSSVSGTTVRCAFDFHALRSGEMGVGPFTGSAFDLVVRDGEVVRVSQSWEIQEFSPQVWEPFAEWVSMTYPQDAAVMYVDGSLTSVRLTQESIRLWARRTREYVEEVGE
jgi:hypothetical protein